MDAWNLGKKCDGTRCEYQQGGKEEAMYYGTLLHS